MKIEQLKYLLANWEERLAKEQTPENLRKTLFSEFGKNPPAKIVDLFGNYQSAYSNLAYQYKELRKFITETEAKKLTEIPNEEIPNFDRDKLLADQYNLYTASSNLFVERNLIYRQKHASTKTILKTPEAEEKIVFTTPDFSNAFLSEFTNPLNQLCKIFSGPFNQDSVNRRLTEQRFERLEKNQISEQFYKDYPRQISALNGQPGNYEDTQANRQRTSSVFTNFIDPYLTSLEKKFQPTNKSFDKDAMRSGLTGLVSTLGAQSTLLNILLKSPLYYISLTHNSFVDGQKNHYTDIERFPFHAAQGIELTQSRLSFNQTTNKLEVEVFLAGRMGILEGIEPVDGKLTEKLTFSVDIDVDPKGNPIFKIENVAFSLIMTQSPGIPEKKVQIMVDESILKSTKNTNSTYIDSLNAQLDDFVKFNDYHNSLENLLYKAPDENDLDLEKVEKKARERARDEAKLQRLDTRFIEKFSKNPSELALLTQLHRHHYQDHLGKKVLVKDILTFFAEQFPKIPYTDKARYIYLLKIAKNLGAAPKEINSVLAKALDQSFKQEGGLNKSERSGITLLYTDLYKSISTEKSIFTAEQVDQRIAALVDQLAKEFENPGKNINKDRYIFFINRAVEYEKISFKEAIEKLNSVFHPRETINILFRRNNSLDTIFEAAKLNQAIYQELVTPDKNPNYFLRSFRESLPVWLGGIKKMPSFTLEQKLDLMAKYNNLIEENNPKNPYTQLQEQCRSTLNSHPSFEDKLNFLINHTKDISQESENEMATKLNIIGSIFFTGLSEYLQVTPTEFDYLITNSNPLLLKCLRERPEMVDAFLDYAKQGDTSPKSIEERLLKITNNKNTHPEEITQYQLEQRFGQDFINKLTKDLDELSKNPITLPNNELDTMCKMFEKNWLSQAIGLTSESQEFITTQLERIKTSENAAKQSQKAAILPGKPETTSEKPAESADSTSAKSSPTSEKLAETSTTPAKSSPTNEQPADNSSSKIAAAALGFNQGPILSSSPVHTHTNESTPTPKSEPSSDNTPSSSYTP